MKGFHISTVRRADEQASPIRPSLRMAEGPSARVVSASSQSQRPGAPSKWSVPIVHASPLDFLLARRHGLVVSVRHGPTEGRDNIVRRGAASNPPQKGDAHMSPRVDCAQSASSKKYVQRRTASALPPTLSAAYH